MGKVTIDEETLDGIGQAIIAKGGSTVPMTPAQMPAAIQSIPSGGGSYDYVNPFDWIGAPDIRDVLANDDPYSDGLFTEEQVPRNAPRHIILFQAPCSFYGYTFYNAFYRTSNGQSGRFEYNSQISLERTSGSPWAWVIFYNPTSPFVNLNGNNYILWAFSNDQVESNYSKNLNYFSNCSIGRGNAASVIDFKNVNLTVTSTYDFHVSMLLLKSFSTNQENMGNGTNFIKSIPDYFTATKTSGTFSLSSYLLKRLPTHPTLYVSTTFANCKILDVDSVATFDGGVVTGGFVGNLNECEISGQTITFSNETKDSFSSSEWEAIKSTLAAKNWGCSPA